MRAIVLKLHVINEKRTHLALTKPGPGGERDQVLRFIVGGPKEPGELVERKERRRFVRAPGLLHAKVSARIDLDELVVDGGAVDGAEQIHCVRDGLAREPLAAKRTDPIVHMLSLHVIERPRRAIPRRDVRLPTSLFVLRVPVTVELAPVDHFAAVRFERFARLQNAYVRSDERSVERDFSFDARVVNFSNRDLRFTRKTRIELVDAADKATFDRSCSARTSHRFEAFGL